MRRFPGSEPGGARQKRGVPGRALPVFFMAASPADGVMSLVRQVDEPCIGDGLVPLPTFIDGGVVYFGSAPSLSLPVPRK